MFDINIEEFCTGSIPLKSKKEESIPLVTDLLTDIEVAIKQAVKVCLENQENVYFKLDGIEVGLDYDKIFDGLVSRRIDNYNRTLQATNRKDG